jgi:hypothetical protein
VDRKYIDIYKAFFQNYRRTGDPEVRDMFAYALGRFKEIDVAGASPEALAVAEEHGWDLREGRLNNDKRAKLLRCEHHLPKKQVLDMLLCKTEMPVWDEETALAILGRCQCYWITPEQNEALNKAGFKDTRPKSAS